MEKIRKQLKRSIKPYDTVIARYVLRPLSAVIVQYLSKTFVTPNEITVSKFLLEICVAFFWIWGNFYQILCTLPLVFLALLFDCVDGDLARVKNMETPMGAWLDLILDRTGDGILFLSAALISCVKNVAYTSWILAYVAVFGILMDALTTEKQHTLVKDFKPAITCITNSFFREVILLFSGDFFLIALTIGVIINKIDLALGFIALLSNGYWTTRIIVYWKNSGILDFDHKQNAEHEGG